MPITGDPNAVAIATFKGVPLSMGDCFIKTTPDQLQTVYEVTGQFVALDSASPVDVSGAVRASAETYLEQVVNLVGGVVQPQEIVGPAGRRIILPSSYVVGSLFNPYSNVTYTQLALTGVQSADAGGKHYTVTYTFTKPKSAAGDGTLASMLLFDGTQIGDRGGSASLSYDGSAVRISATSYYVGSNPVTYLTNLCNALGLEPLNVSAVPRAASSARSSLRSFSGTTGTFELTGKGTVASAMLESLSANEETPGIFTINTTFVASR
jgi:hypothetical protein